MKALLTIDAFGPAIWRREEPPVYLKAFAEDGPKVWLKKRMFQAGPIFEADAVRVYFPGLGDGLPEGFSGEVEITATLQEPVGRRRG